MDIHPRYFLQTEGSKCVFGAILNAFHAEYALRTVLSVSRIIRYIYVHGTYAPAFSALYASVLFALDAYQRIIAHWLKEHCYRAGVLAERPIVPECEGEDNTCNVVYNVPDNECK